MQASDPPHCLRTGGANSLAVTIRRQMCPLVRAAAADNQNDKQQHPGGASRYRWILVYLISDRSDVPFILHGMRASQRSDTAMLYLLRPLSSSTALRHTAALSPPPFRLCRLYGLEVSVLSLSTRHRSCFSLSGPGSVHDRHQLRWRLGVATCCASPSSSNATNDTLSALGTRFMSYPWISREVSPNQRLQIGLAETQHAGTPSPTKHTHPAPSRSTSRSTNNRSTSLWPPSISLIL